MPTTILIDTIEKAMSRSDRAAVEHAIGLSLGSDVQVCCPSCDEAAIRYAVAAGARKLVLQEQIEAGLVICGLGGLGFDGELKAACIANQHQAQLALEVLTFLKQGDLLKVFRKLDRGEMEVLLIALPAVLVMSESAKTIQYLSRFRQTTASIPEAKQQPVTQVVRCWEAVRPRTKTSDLSNKTSAGAHQRMFATFGIDKVSAGMSSSDPSEILRDPEECAAQLVRYLAHHGFIESKKDESIQTADLTKVSGLDAPSKPAQPEQRPNSTRHNNDTFSSGLNRHVPQPMQMSADAFRVKRTRQPRSMDQLGHRKPRMDQTFQARYRRRPRPIHLTEPTNQRGPIPLQVPLKEGRKFFPSNQ